MRTWAWLLIGLLLSPAAARAEGWQWDSGYKGDVPDAIDVRTDTTLFGTNLGATDTDVQKALDTLDELVAVGGSGDAVTVNSTTADTTANFLDNIYTDFSLADGGAGGPDDITAKPNYNAASGDIALLANEGAFAANGFVFEGATANTIELYFAIPDPATTDKTITFPNATDTLVGRDTTDTLTNKTLTAADNAIGADTAVALSADPANCATSTHFAVGVAASGAAECEAIGDADVPNDITVDLATLASTVTVVDGTDATSFPAIFDSATGSLAIKTDAGLTYAADTGTLSATVLTEGANAVFNSSEVPGGELGGTWASPTLDDSLTVASWTLQGATMTAELFVDATGAEFEPGDALTDCSTFAATGGGIFYDDSEGKFKKCQDNTLSDLDNDSGGATAINNLGDASANGAVALGGTAQVWSGDTNDVTAIAQDVLTLDFTNDAATDILTQRLLVLSNLAGANGIESLLTIINADADDVVTDGILFDVAGGGMTTAINATDAQITTALAIGANTITAADGGLVDLSAVSVSGTSEGLLLPQHATDCSTAGTTEGQVCWEADANTLYIGNGATVTAIGSGSDTNAVKEYWWPCAATLPLEAAEVIPPLSKDAGTNLDQLACGFDADADEGRTVVFKVPSDVQSGSTVTFRAYSYSAAATTGDFIVEIRHNSGVADGVDPDASLTTVSAAADTTAGTAGQLNITTWTETLANLGWAANDLVYGVFYRDANAAGDTLAGDLLIIGFSVEIPRA